MKGFYFTLLSLFLSFSMYAATASAFTVPECLDNEDTAIPVDNAKALNFKTTKPNQSLARAHVQGNIDTLYPNHSGHQHFSIRIGNEPNDKIEVVYSIDYGIIKNPEPGMSVEACGDLIVSNAAAGGYPASPVGAIIHWIHRSDNDKHQSGFVMVNGTLYGQGEGTDD